MVSLASYDPEGLDWLKGMGKGNVTEYRAARRGPDSPARHLKPITDETWRNPVGSVPYTDEGAPERDRLIASDPPPLEMFGESSAEALRHSADGWIDDDLSLLRPWGFDVADIRAPTRLRNSALDVFLPMGHSRLPAGRIPGPAATLDLDERHGHLGSLQIMPELFGRLLSFSR